MAIVATDHYRTYTPRPFTRDQKEGLAGTGCAGGSSGTGAGGTVAARIVAALDEHLEDRTATRGV